MFYTECPWKLDTRRRTNSRQEGNQGTWQWKTCSFQASNGDDHTKSDKCIKTQNINPISIRLQFPHTYTSALNIHTNTICLTLLPFVSIYQGVRTGSSGPVRFRHWRGSIALGPRVLTVVVYFFIWIYFKNLTWHT